MTLVGFPQFISKGIYFCDSGCFPALWASVFRQILHGGNSHYENTPIQIYRKFHLQKKKKLKKNQIKNPDIFHISA